MRGAYTLQSTWDGKHQSKHRDLRHVNIVSHSHVRDTVSTAHVAKRKGGGANDEMPTWGATGGGIFDSFLRTKMTMSTTKKKPANDMLNGCHPLTRLYYAWGGC